MTLRWFCLMPKPTKYVIRPIPIMKMFMERKASSPAVSSIPPAVDQQAPATVSNVERQGQPLDRREDPGRRRIGECRITAPITSGSRMVRRSGFASDEVLIVTPLISTGAISGHQHHRADHHRRDEALREAHVPAGLRHHLLEEGRDGRQAGEEHHDHVRRLQRKDPVIR